MFDSATAQLLRSAPPVPGLDPQSIPALLTRHYANLVSARLSGTSDAASDGESGWTLERISDTYELVTSLQTEGSVRRAAAFVAGTAQQILARRQAAASAGHAVVSNVDRDRLDPTIAAALLFLAAEQYADAHEAASHILPRRDGQSYEATILSENVADLARGQLDRIYERASRWRARRREIGLEEQALAALLEALIVGIETLAARFLGLPTPQPAVGRFDTARAAFERVLQLSAVFDDQYGDVLGGNILNIYAGPHHLASLLIAAHDGIASAALADLPPPGGADAKFWGKWIRARANAFPFLWPNHREAVAQGFHDTGKSAVVVLPTGAGKTTVSSLKLAGALARGKKVVFLAPTHALVEQLTGDLQEIFPQELLGSVVSSDFDLLFQLDAQLRDIEVMTPERCLAMLSFAPEAFSDVGLLVFDECHLLSPQSGKIRRALDGMLCVLGFNHIAPDADLLFLSAMLKNGPEFADWIHHFTGRDCVCVDLLWKPSRQARGVLIYKNGELEDAKKAAMAAQLAENTKKAKKAKGLRAVAKRELAARPWAIWGLQHNWQGQKQAHCMTQVLDAPVELVGDIKYGSLQIKPNANRVAAKLAISATRTGLKSIVFVNTKSDAVSVAGEISAELNEKIDVTEAEQERWDALEAELGGLKHSLLPQPAIAVPHNSAMLRLERDLAERMFKRANGAKVIVATPTLAQGLNLPAQLAILAGDKRADAEQKGRADLEAHEILNAAARAGRAGHLANGVVLLIPEPIISFSEGEPLGRKVIKKLKSVLPEDDRCVVISDPLEIVLDRLMQGQTIDPDVRYVVNRMAALREAEGAEEPNVLFDLRKSFGAFAARKRHSEAEFEAKITDLKKAIAMDAPGEVDNTIAELASQSGLSMNLLLRLRKRIAGGAGSLPITIGGWLTWTIDWLTADDDARHWLLGGVSRSLMASCGRKRGAELTAKELALILPGLVAWINGKPLCEVERALGGDPDSDDDAEKMCPRARELVGTVVPRGLSFIVGLVSHVVEEVDPFGQQEKLDRQVIECLGPAVRKGYDTPAKVFLSSNTPAPLSRVQLHELALRQSFSE
ncbi:DEAD/DEAH box helicase [Methylocella tundrae]|uniref:DEAD/DEAH box helicase n=1 Tax=Methylocella tundrae TaxID=227605 RepID=A0A8B6M716_METTU|nr:DEAD/DEAH box helicase [Methylocella tundrae]VTZ26109.1 DEAD/DEAH box helicase [Methylocella tundrae]VTZ50548.1 DEAD/DEAH box helicase [Methylocella tundrae]